MPVLGLDVGGANLKAHSQGVSRLMPFPLWKDPAGLPAALDQLTEELPKSETLAVTMTGELCDCFETKRQGVHAILDAVERIARGRRVRVWRNEGRFGTVAEARAAPLSVAAANWLTVAYLAGRHASSGPALLVDVGSTTADVVPLQDGRPIPTGRTDPERLRSQELVYTGARRTPLCALLGTGAAEFFATTLDAYLVLGETPEVPGDNDTADGRPATRLHAHARLARMLCADLETSTEPERVELAGLVRKRQITMLADAITTVAGRLPAPPRNVVLAGSGEFLAAAGVRQSAAASAAHVVSLGGLLGPAASSAACAVAVALLAEEEHA
jgi:probable H4MPT-linked C1 transfer pathway protein